MLCGKRISEVDNWDEKWKELPQSDQESHTQRFHLRICHVHELNADPSKLKAPLSSSQLEFTGRQPTSLGEARVRECESRCQGSGSLETEKIRPRFCRCRLPWTQRQARTGHAKYRNVQTSERRTCNVEHGFPRVFSVAGIHSFLTYCHVRRKNQGGDQHCYSNRPFFKMFLCFIQRKWGIGLNSKQFSTGIRLSYFFQIGRCQSTEDNAECDCKRREVLSRFLPSTQIEDIHEQACQQRTLKVSQLLLHLNIHHTDLNIIWRGTGTWKLSAWLLITLTTKNRITMGM